MLGMPILDVAIGLAFFYLLFALVCTTVNETLSRLLRQRPKTLEEAISNLLGGSSWTEKILQHPLIAGGARKDKNGKLETPSYIDPKVFATALLDHFTPNADLRDLEAFKTGIKELPEGTRQALNTLLQQAQGDWDKFHTHIEDWYKAVMDRAEGWYKRYVQKQTKLLALVIVLWVNFDSLHVADRLWTDSALRSSVVEQAKARAQSRPEQSKDLPLVRYEDPRNPAQGKPINVEKGPLSSEEQALIGSVTGWGPDIQELSSRMQRQSGSYVPLFPWLLMHLLGWTLSVFAISLGAPFWFDTLNRFMNLRNAGRAPDEPRAKNVGGQQKKEGGE